METVNRNIHALLNSIQKCQIYKDFKKQDRNSEQKSGAGREGAAFSR